MEDEFTSMQVLLAITQLSVEQLDAIKKEGGDFPTNVVAKALNINKARVSPAMRGTAKSALFAYIYGMRGSEIRRHLQRPRRLEDEDG